MKRLPAMMLLLGVTLLPSTFRGDARVEGAGGSKRALLIGVTRYYHLEGKDLDGPANDVRLTRDLLTGLYGFPAGQVVCLTEEEGKPELKPTRANIERELKALAAATRAGDQIMVLMAGHGGRQPQPPDAKVPEPDGIDEIFLPADVKKWTNGKDRCPGAIIDDEIGEWLAALTAKKAHVWAVFDCCHSGTMTRGSEKVRELPPGVLVPEEELRKARERAAKRGGERARGDATRPPAFSPARSADYLVALYACAAHETTPEGPQPVEAADAKSHGLLSYTLNGILRQAAASGQPITYRELAQRIQQKYLGRLNGSPSPAIEGKGQDRIVFDTKEPKRPPFVFRQRAGKVRVSAGDLHGLTVGSVVAAYPPAGEKDADRLIGHARVVEAGPFEAVVVPAEYQGKPAPKALPKEGRCEIVYTDYSLRQLRVAVVAEKGGEAARKAAAEKLAEALKERPGVCAVATDAARADLLVRCKADGVELVEASGHGRPLPLPPADRPAFGKALVEAVEKVHRAKNLLAVAGRVGEERHGGKAEVDVKVELLRQRGGGKVEVLTPGAAGLVLRGEDRVSFRLTNTSPSKRIQVTLLLVGMDHKIESFYPEADEVSKALAPGESMETPAGTIGNDPPFGDERLVVIAVPAQVPQVDFRLLTQPGVTRGYSERGSPLAVLLNRALHGEGTRGGLGRGEVRQQSMQVLGWRTEPKR